MTREEKRQAQDVLDGMLRDSYMNGYRDGLENRRRVNESSKESNIEMRMCKNCIWCHEESECLRVATEHVDPVSGKITLTGKKWCEYERTSSGSCGPVGLHFEAIEPLSSRAWNWIKSFLLSDAR